MIQLPKSSEMQAFGEFLRAHAYDTEHLTARLGRARPPAPGELQQMFDDSREITTPNLLVRLFLLGGTVDEETTRNYLPAGIFESCIRHRFLTVDGGTVRAEIVVIPVDDLLFLSDAFHVLGSDEASDFVLPASTHSANFLRLLTMRTPVASALDLGCGCGIQALFAARHADQVVATDISERALYYTRVNALLNGMDNVECRGGNLFDPVQGRAFDLIVSNPPFVIGPGEEYVYRDNPLKLDEFCGELVREAPAYLRTGGHLQMLCEWVEVSGEDWPRRLAGWIRGCDAWVLHGAPIPPPQYVQQRSMDITGSGVTKGSTDAWQSYFDENAVTAVHPGMIALRRRDGPNWLHVQNLSGDVVSPAGQAVVDGFAAVDFIEACDDPSLSEACLGLADALSAEQLESGDGAEIYVKLDNGLNTDAEIDGPVAAFINLFDGIRTVGQCIVEFATVTDADPDQLGADLLAIVRVFVSRGFLVPLNLD